MALIYIIRHGNTFDPGDIICRIGARTDLPLSSSGRAQAQSLAQHFADINFHYAFSSALKRQRQTAQIIAQQQREPCPIQNAEFLTEIDYGADDGRPEAELIKRIGRKALTDWDMYNSVPPGWTVDIEAIKTAWRQFLQGLAHDQSLKNNTPICVVTSNGIARFVLDIIEPICSEQNTLTSPKLRTGAYGIIEVEQQQNSAKQSVTNPVKSRLKAWDIRPEETTTK